MFTIILKLTDNKRFFMIRYFDDLFETFCVGWWGRRFIPCVLYTIEGVFLDIIINIDYLIEFQFPMVKYIINVFIDR